VKIAIKIELIADDFFCCQNQMMRQDFKRWLRYMRKLGLDKAESAVYKITPTGKIKQNGMRDYSYANFNGSRGIFAFYFLEDGIYEIHKRYKINKVRRYLISVKQGIYEEIHGK
jgi:hypothetical protein